MDTTFPAPLAPAAPNAGDYQLIHADTNDEMLVEMWITKPRRARSRHTHAQYRRVWTALRHALGQCFAGHTEHGETADCRRQIPL